MKEASRRVAPSTFDLATHSEPARSTRASAERVSVLVRRLMHSIVSVTTLQAGGREKGTRGGDGVRG